VGVGSRAPHIDAMRLGDYAGFVYRMSRL